MRQVQQTRLGNPGGNCFQAAVASLFDRELDTVPDFHNEPGDPAVGGVDVDWTAPFVKWVADTYELDVWFVSPVEFPYASPITGIVVGEHGDAPHAVVYRNGRLYWNPAGHAYGDLDRVTYAITFGPTVRTLERHVYDRNVRAGQDRRLLELP